MDIYVVQHHTVDSWNGPPPTFAAVGIDEEAAKVWIQDEVDGKHQSSHSYAQGHTADWWLEYGAFSIKKVEVQMGTSNV